MCGTTAHLTQRLTAAQRRACNTQACPSYYYSTGAWGLCSERCTSKNGRAGSRTRTVNCTNGNTGLVPDALCVSANVTRPMVEQSCNTRLCVSYGWTMGAWNSCTKTCGGGAQARTVRCEASDGSNVTDISLCGSRPRSIADCNVQPCDPCAKQTCSGHGACSGDGICTCEIGYKGVRCGTPVSCAGLYDKDGNCCESSVLRPDGGCCSGNKPALASDGTCCDSDQLDACGECSGSAKIVDLLGRCCDGVLGEDGLCCVSGILDSCGVCDGDGSSCNVEVTLVLPAPPGAANSSTALDAMWESNYASQVRRELADVLAVPEDRINVTVSVTQTEAEARRLTASPEVTRRLSISNIVAVARVAQEQALDQDQRLHQSAKPPLTTIAVLERLDAVSTTVESNNMNTSTPTTTLLSTAAVGGVRPVAVCGNGVCEVGERCDAATCASGCQRDCPYIKHACPTPSWAGGGECSGKGICVGASGACECFTGHGYTGVACEQCTNGFIFEAATQTCLPVYIPAGTTSLPPAVVVLKTTIAPRVTAAQDTSKAGGGVTIGAALFAAVATVIIAGVLVTRKRRLQRHHARAQLTTKGFKTAAFEPADHAWSNSDATALSASRHIVGFPRPAVMSRPVPAATSIKVAEFEGLEAIDDDMALQSASTRSVSLASAVTLHGGKWAIDL